MNSSHTRLSPVHHPLLAKPDRRNHLVRDQPTPIDSPYSHASPVHRKLLEELDRRERVAIRNPPTPMDSSNFQPSLVYQAPLAKANSRNHIVVRDTLSTRDSPNSQPTQGHKTGVDISYSRPPATVRTPDEVPQARQPAVPMSAQHEFRRQDIVRRALGQQRREDGQHVLREMERLEREAQQWKGRCWACIMHDLDPAHDLFSCRNPNNHEARMWYLSMRNRLSYERNSCCFTCGMPQRICDPRARTGPCAYRDVLLPMYAMMLYANLPGSMETPTQDVRRLWRTQLRDNHDINPDDKKAVAVFLSQGVHGWVFTTQLVWAFLKLRGYYQVYHM